MDRADFKSVKRRDTTLVGSTPTLFRHWIEFIFLALFGSVAVVEFGRKELRRWPGDMSAVNYSVVSCLRS